MARMHISAFTSIKNDICICNTVDINNTIAGKTKDEAMQEYITKVTQLLEA